MQALSKDNKVVDMEHQWEHSQAVAAKYGNLVVKPGLIDVEFVTF